VAGGRTWGGIGEEYSEKLPAISGNSVPVQAVEMGVEVGRTLVTMDFGCSQLKPFNKLLEVQ